MDPSRLATTGGEATRDAASAVHEITSETEWRKFVEECTRPTVVKFYQNGCRSCRALKPKFDHIADELGAGASFFEVCLQHARPILLREQIGSVPSVHIYCPGIGRASGTGFTGARTASQMRKMLLHVLEPDVASSLAAARPATLQPATRLCALVDLLRSISEAPRLLEAARAAAEGAAGTAAAGRPLSDARRAETSAVFRRLDSAAGGLLDVDALAAATRALAASADEGAALPAGCFAPSRLAVAGLATERAVLEEAVGAARSLGRLCGADADGCGAEVEWEETGPPSGTLNLPSLLALVAAHDAALRRRKQPRGGHVAAAFAALDAEGTGGMPIAVAAERLAAVDRALPPPADGAGLADAGALERLLAALDVEGEGLLTPPAFARAAVRV